MNTFVYFALGYGVFLIIFFVYLVRLQKKQNEIKKLIQELKAKNN